MPSFQPQPAVTAGADPPTFVCKGTTASIYRQPPSFGFKVIEDLDPTEEQVLNLVSDDQISRYLPPRCAQRRALNLKSFQGNPALYFQWAEGVSIREWLACGDNARVGLEERLRIATAIAKSLSEFHEGDVLHLYLTEENIIINMSEGRCHASLINLSRAEVISQMSDVDTRGAMKAELRDLGHVLNALFRGESAKDSKYVTDSDSDDADEISARCKRGKLQRPGEDLPIYLTSMISTLILAEANEGSAETYEDARSVFLDLEAAARKFHIYFDPFNHDAYAGNNKLKLPPDAFYGRENELAKLLHSFESVVKVEGQPVCVAVSGYGGSGKTSLINQIKGPLDAAGGYFISGKFDPSSRPDSVIFGALNTFFGSIINGESEDVQLELKSRIMEGVGSECSMLPVPNLAKLLGEANDPAGALHQMQWEFIVGRLFAAISTRSHPIVCFFDDLQWADETSLEAFQMLALDPDVRFVTYLFSHRDDEIAPKERISKILDGIESQHVTVQRIKLGPLEKEVVNTICSENLYLPPSLCRSLSNIVHTKTGGIVLFVINFLKSLNEDGILRFNLSLGRYEYDNEQIQITAMDGISAGVTQYLTSQMTRLGTKVQLALKVASCLGFTMNAPILTHALAGLGVDSDVLGDVLSNGYLQRRGTGQLIWAHDQLHQAAYALIGPTKRKSFHLLIGSRILLNTTGDKLEENVFEIVRHMNIGVELIKSQSQKEEVAKLNVIAGEKATKSSSFHSAADYFLVAISLQSEDSGYDFLMKLYNLSLEPLFAIGNFSKLEQIIDKILSLSKSFDEKLNAHHYLVRLFASNGKFGVTDVISNAVGVLEQLGVDLPVEELSPSLVAEEMGEVRLILSNYAEGDILGLPRMTDQRKLTAMQFLSETITMAFFGKPLLLPVTVVRMIKLSIEHGLCELSSIGFSVYGALLIGVQNKACDFDFCVSMGRIAVKIMARVYTTVYGNLFFWREPFQAALEKHLEAFDAGALAGDMEYAFSSIMQYIGAALWACGENLVVLEGDIRKHLRRAMSYKQGVQAKCLVIMHSQVLKLVGSREDPYSTFYQSKEADFFQAAQDRNELAVCRLIPTKCMFVSIFNGDMDSARKWFEVRQKYLQKSQTAGPRFVGQVIAEFLDGLVAFHFAREATKDNEQWAEIGEGNINLLRQWSASSEWNFRNKLELLEAEFYYFRGDKSNALEKYQAAIRSAQDHRFVHEEGLANIKSAEFLLRMGRQESALVHLTQAKKCYEVWGALTLVKYADAEIE
ncbi:hypothetical protein ACHAWF_017381, partial [Thalassiosira exigua]